MMGGDEFGSLVLEAFRALPQIPLPGVKIVALVQIAEGLARGEIRLAAPPAAPEVATDAPQDVGTGPYSAEPEGTE